MKKIYILLCSFLVISGCNDFVELEPDSQFSSDNFYQSQEDVEQAVVGAYDALQSIGQYGQYFVYFMEVRADNSAQESTTNSGGVFAAFDIFNLQPSNDVLNTTWEACYDGINRVNTVLANMDEVSLDSEIEAVRTGELLFLRALTYFNLVRLWGDVPLTLTETIDPIDAFAVGRAPSAQVYEQIILDLEEALTLLPGINESGRATLGAAYTLLGSSSRSPYQCHLIHSIPARNQFLRYFRYSE